MTAGSPVRPVMDRSMTRPAALPGAISQQLGEEFFRYLAVSAGGLVVDLALLIWFTESVGLSYLWSAAIGFVAGAGVVYWLSVTWVFRYRRLRDKPAAELGLFLAIGLVGLGLNEVVLFAVTEGVGVHYLVSKVFAVGTVFMWNFAARKCLLFRPGPTT